jgi:very-short-patch-repair endonuclease
VTDTPAVVLRRKALAAGFSDDELAALVRTREWVRLRRGAYLDGPLPADVLIRHRLLVTATVAALRKPAVISHQSAAALHGMPLWGVRLDRVHVTRSPPAWNDTSAVLVAHVARLREDEALQVDGIMTTSAVRTALDLARSLPFEAAVVALDASLAAQAVRAEHLAERLFDITGTPGSRAGARAVRFADGRSESVGESRSRVLLHRLGLPPSDIQFRVTAPGGGFVAQTDFVWEEERLVGEFDGRVKYGRLLRPGQSPGDVVFEEKRREDAIRDEGWSVVRWTWGDLQQPDRLAARVRRALRRRAS